MSITALSDMNTLMCIASNTFSQDTTDHCRHTILYQEYVNRKFNCLTYAYGIHIISVHVGKYEGDVTTNI